MMIRGHWRLPLAIVSVMACGSLLYGCTPGNESDELGIPKKNIDTWSMPLDPYIEVTRSPYPREAWLVTMTGCMDEAGFDAPEVPQGYAPPADPVRNSADYRVFNTRIAEQYGYHQGPYLPGYQFEDAGDEMSKRLETWGASGMRAFEACGEKYDYLLGSPGDTARNLSGQASHNVEQSGRLDDEKEAWVECMKPLGISSLPDDPGEFPTTEAQKAVGFDNPEDAEIIPSVPTPEEIALAVHDAGCRESSGYLQELYDLEWDEQLQLLESNKATLDAERLKAEETIEEARKVANDR